MTTAEDVIARAREVAWIQDQGDDGRPHDALVRAEAAQMIVSIEGWEGTPAADEVAWFSDVLDSDWYFATAHLVRRHGIFRGTRENALMGRSVLTHADAGRVLERYTPGSAARVTRDEQVVHLAPGAMPPDASLSMEGLLEKETLAADEIARVRELAASMPPEQAREIQRRIAEHVKCRNHRNNVGEWAGDGDSMCNWTAIAMVLNSQGIGRDESGAQMEDQLDAARTGDRYSKTSRSAHVENQLGLGQEYERMAFSDAAGLQAWSAEHVAPRLERAEGAYMGNPDQATYTWNHIARIERVEADGVKVDDPYGEAVWDGARYTYTSSSSSTRTTEDGRGRDNLWSWEKLATIASPGGSYVHFFWQKEPVDRPHPRGREPVMPDRCELRPRRPAQSTSCVRWRAARSVVLDVLQDTCGSGVAAAAPVGFARPSCRFLISPGPD